MTVRVGLLGGTFDPPHLGHLVVAEVARVALRLDEVRLLVAGDPWMKSTTADGRTRAALVRAAVADDPFLDVDEREVERDGPTYTAETLEELAAERPEVAWHFLLGADAAQGMARWHRIDDALSLARFVVVTRPGHGIDVPDGFTDRLTTLVVPGIDISSSDLRARYRDGAATRYLVPTRVDQYVRERRLYGAGDRWEPDRG